MAKFLVCFDSKEDAQLALWGASCTNYSLLDKVELRLKVKYCDADRERKVIPCHDGGLLEETETSGGDLDFEDACFYFAK